MFYYDGEISPRDSSIPTVPKVRGRALADKPELAISTAPVLVPLTA